jgi:beta-glucosidase-like glycosyl hydrolase
MIVVLQEHGIAACGKHFPGHGDTSVDSHIQLPVLKQDLKRLRRSELKPFQKAIEAGVRMIMLGHLSVPALDPAGTPVSLSRKAVQFIRRDMGYGGMLITDALNMGGIGDNSEEEASFMALEAGVDILLHPSDPEKIATYLEKRSSVLSNSRLLAFRRGLIRTPGKRHPSFIMHRKTSDTVTRRAIHLTGDVCIQDTPQLIILSDEMGERGRPFARELKKTFPRMAVRRPGSGSGIRKPGGHDARTIVAVFSETRAWKGAAGAWLREIISSYSDRAGLFVSFGNPYLLDGIDNVPRMYVYWSSESAQEAAAGFIARSCSISKKTIS